MQVAKKIFVLMKTLITIKRVNVSWKLSFRAELLKISFQQVYFSSSSSEIKPYLIFHSAAITNLTYIRQF